MNVERGVVLAGRVETARSALSRARGLLLRRALRADEGLLLRPCRGVHTIGMLYPIDVVFLDGEGRVVRAYHGLRPMRVTGWIARARCALELATGTLDRTGTLEGDRIQLME